MSKENDPVLLACEAEWESWKGDCSGFVKAVAARFAVPLSGQANQLVDFLGHSPEWNNLGHDGNAARRQAHLGNFVIGGLKGRSHGHVVVIVDLPSSRYPVGYWGQFGGIGRKRATINWSFRQSALSNVEFFARAL
jgi:hypothetical protein